MSNIMSKSEQNKAVAQTTTVANTLPVMTVAPSVAPPIVDSATSWSAKIKNFFTTPVSAGSKIQYWHVALGAVVAFVLYVEMMADRKTQRKLKFW